MLQKEYSLNGKSQIDVVFWFIVIWFCFLFTEDSFLFSDPAMKQFLLNLDETNSLGRKFVLHDLDDRHLFVEAEILKTIKDKIDELLDRMSVRLEQQ